MNIRSMGRHVRTRLYFTSESHVHALLNVLRYGSIADTLSQNVDEWAPGYSGSDDSDLPNSPERSGSLDHRGSPRSAGSPKSPKSPKKKGGIIVKAIVITMAAAIITIKSIIKSRRLSMLMTIQRHRQIALTSPRKRVVVPS